MARKEDSHYGDPTFKKNKKIKKIKLSNRYQRDRRAVTWSYPFSVRQGTKLMPHVYWETHDLGVEVVIIIESFIWSLAILQM